MQPNQTMGPIFHIEVEKIKPNPYQPRRDFDEASLRELAGSIREFGLLHPLVVTKVEIPGENGTDVEYQLISGERRWRAAKLVGLERVPAMIRVAPTDRDRLELAIVENIQRENLNPIETARAYAKLQDQFGLTQREVAVRVGKSREVVANSIRLLNLPSPIQDAVSKNQINESQGRMLLMLPDIREQQGLFDELIRENLSVRELRHRIASRRSVSLVMTDVKTADPETSSVEEQLREVLGTKVKLQKEGDGGKLTINFYSQEELQGIIERLTRVQMAMEQPPIIESAPPQDFTV